MSWLHRRDKKPHFLVVEKRQQSVRRFLATPIASVQTDPGTALYVEVRDFWMDGKHSTIIFVSLKNKSLSIYTCVSIYKRLLLCFFCLNLSLWLCHHDDCAVCFRSCGNFIVLLSLTAAARCCLLFAGLGEEQTRTDRGHRHHLCRVWATTVLAAGGLDTPPGE